MLHVFLLTVMLGDTTISKDMHFFDITRCNYFASQTVKRYGNYKYYSSVPPDKRATAYCTPVLVSMADINSGKVLVYQ
tara:strand:- start:1362 stop:1595 length:234 start_codon:yes stop_codon:yes gene_type:complete